MLYTHCFAIRDLFCTFGLSHTAFLEPHEARQPPWLRGAVTARGAHEGSRPTPRRHQGPMVGLFDLLLGHALHVQAGQRRGLAAALLLQHLEPCLAW